MNAFIVVSQSYLVLSQKVAAVVVVTIIIIIAGFMIVTFCSCVQQLAH